MKILNVKAHGNTGCNHLLFEVDIDGKIETRLYHLSDFIEQSDPMVLADPVFIAIKTVASGKSKDELLIIKDKDL